MSDNETPTDTDARSGGPKFAAKPDVLRKKPKRFYKTVSIIKDADHHAIHLDDRPIKTPMKNTLKVPSENLAKAIAKEWDDQQEEIDHETMISTKLANTAIDRVGPRRKEIMDEIINFAGTDLLCYRDESIRDLQDLESQIWDPFLSWLETDHDVKLKSASGITHVSQDEEELLKFKALYDAFDEYALTALHNMTSLTGSAILPLALTLGKGWKRDDIWSAAHVDEDYQIKRWGVDEEAEKHRNNRHNEYNLTYAFYEVAKV